VNYDAPAVTVRLVPVEVASRDISSVYVVAGTVVAAHPAPSIG
jgi:hypothetical protein